jgi:hypothetical protein
MGYVARTFDRPSPANAVSGKVGASAQLSGQRTYRELDNPSAKSAHNIVGGGKKQNSAKLSKSGQRAGCLFI